MKGALTTIGVILLVIGLIGVFANYAVTWMWIVAILGFIFLLWGWMASKNKGGMMK